MGIWSPLLESSEKLLSLSDYADSKKKITQICLYFLRISNQCNHLVIGVIRDFWTFSEISSQFIITFSDPIDKRTCFSRSVRPPLFFQVGEDLVANFFDLPQILLFQFLL